MEYCSSSRRDHRTYSSLENYNINNSKDKKGRRKRSGKTVKLSTDAQSVAARQRRHRISERFKILQSLVPGGSKMDTVSMLEEVIHYVKFLKKQIWLHQTMIGCSHHLDITAHHDHDPSSSFPLQLIPPAAPQRHDLPTNQPDHDLYSQFNMLMMMQGNDQTNAFAALPAGRLGFACSSTGSQLCGETMPLHPTLLH